MADTTHKDQAGLPSRPPRVKAARDGPRPRRRGQRLFSIIAGRLGRPRRGGVTGTPVVRLGILLKKRRFFY